MFENCSDCLSVDVGVHCRAILGKGIPRRRGVSVVDPTRPNAGDGTPAATRRVASTSDRPTVYVLPMDRDWRSGAGTIQDGVRQWSPGPHYESDHAPPRSRSGSTSG